jgi:hypothetical protein
VAIDSQPLKGNRRLKAEHLSSLAGFKANTEGPAMKLVMRSMCLLAAAVTLLAACAGPRDPDPGSFYHCDRNGEREQRVAC